MNELLEINIECPVSANDLALNKSGPMPVPDVTTRDGRRLFYSHIDGDGFATPSSFKGHPLCAELIRERILKVFPFPITVSVIESEIRAQAAGYPTEQANRFADMARSIFALPNVQPASHSFSHPYQWDPKDPNPGIYTEPHMPLRPEIDYPVVDSVREIKGSIDYINETLLPKGKKVELMLWSGNCRPGEQALRVCRELGVENMNGGNTIVGRRYLGMAGIAARVMPWGDELQIHAANQNEFMYANGWTGPFFGGFADVIDTFERTDSQRRTKPVNVYYHFYSATSLSSLRASEKIHHWCAENDLHSVTALDYARIAKDAWRTRVFEKGPRHWVISNRGDLRTYLDKQYHRMAEALRSGLGDQTSFKPSDMRSMTAEQLRMLSHLLRLTPKEQLTLIFAGNRTPVSDPFIHGLVLAAVRYIDVIPPRDAWLLIEPSLSKIPASQRIELAELLATNAHAVGKPALAAVNLSPVANLKEAGWPVARNLALAQRWSGQTKKGAEELSRWLKGRAEGVARDDLRSGISLGHEMAMEAGEPSLALDFSIRGLSLLGPSEAIPEEQISAAHGLALQCTRTSVLMPWMKKFVASLPESQVDITELLKPEVQSSGSFATSKKWIRILAQTSDWSSEFDSAFACHLRLAATREILDHPLYDDEMKGQATAKLREIGISQTLEAGYTALQDGYRARAKSILERLQRTAPEDLEVKIFQAEVALAYNKSAQALAQISEIKSKNSDLAFAGQGTLGSALFATGNWEAAFDAYTDILTQPGFEPRDRTEALLQTRLLRPLFRPTLDTSLDVSDEEEGDTYSFQVTYSTGWMKDWRLIAFSHQDYVTLAPGFFTTTSSTRFDGGVTAQRRFNGRFFAGATVGASQRTGMFGARFGKFANQGLGWSLGFMANQRSTESPSVQALDGREDRAEFEVQGTLGDRWLVDFSAYYRQLEIGGDSLGRGFGYEGSLDYILITQTPTRAQLTVGYYGQYQRFDSVKMVPPSVRKQVRRAVVPQEQVRSALASSEEVRRAVPGSFGQEVLDHLVDPEANRQGIRFTLRKRIGDDWTVYAQAGVYYAFDDKRFDYTLAAGIEYYISDDALVYAEVRFDSNARTTSAGVLGANIGALISF